MGISAIGIETVVVLVFVLIVALVAILRVDVTVAAASVVKGSGAVVENGYAGVAITAGEMVHLESNVYVLSDADASLTDNAKSKTRGMALNSALIVGGPLQVLKSGDVDIGTHGVAAGTPLFLSGAAGKICPAADLATNDWVTFVGWVKDANTITLGIKQTLTKLG